MKNIDWTEDTWFAQHHAAHLTPAFKAWWSKYYGHPDDYAERDEYWARCAAAWAGWLGRDESPEK